MCGPPEGQGGQPAMLAPRSLTDAVFSSGSTTFRRQKWHPESLLLLHRSLLRTLSGPETVVHTSKQTLIKWKMHSVSQRPTLQLDREASSDDALWPAGEAFRMLGWRALEPKGGARCAGALILPTHRDVSQAEPSHRPCLSVVSSSHWDGLQPQKALYLTDHSVWASLSSYPSCETSQKEPGLVKVGEFKSHHQNPLAHHFSTSGNLWIPYIVSGASANQSSTTN
jgi:hypothetical protein